MQARARVVGAVSILCACWSLAYACPLVSFVPCIAAGLLIGLVHFWCDMNEVFVKQLANDALLFFILLQLHSCSSRVSGSHAHLLVCTHVTEVVLCLNVSCFVLLQDFTAKRAINCTRIRFLLFRKSADGAQLASGCNTAALSDKFTCDFTCS